MLVSLPVLIVADVGEKELVTQIIRKVIYESYTSADKYWAYN